MSPQYAVQLPTNKAAGKSNIDKVASANHPTIPSPLDTNDGFSSASLNMARSAITYTHTPKSSISTTPKLPLCELEAVVFARLDIDWCHTNYISQVIDAQNTRLHTYETARGTSKGIESAANKTAFEKTLLLGKLVSHTEALRKQLDNLAPKRVASSPALPSSQAILASVMTMYPGCHTANLKNVHRLPVDTVESHICMYGDLQLQLVSAIITASKTIAEMKHQQAYRTSTTLTTVKEKKMQKSDIATSETEIGENGSQHDHFGDLPGLVSSKSDKLVTTSVRMIPEAITTAFERTSTDATDVADFRDNYQPISHAVAYRSLLDEDDQERLALVSVLPTLEPRRKASQETVIPFPRKS